MATYAEQLASVNAAIAAIESGAQSYGKGDVQLTRADLGELYKERARLTPLARSESRGRSGIRIGYIR